MKLILHCCQEVGEWLHNERTVIISPLRIVDQSLHSTGLRYLESATVVFSYLCLFILWPLKLIFQYQLITSLDINIIAHFHVQYLPFIPHFCKHCSYIRVNNRLRPFCFPVGLKCLIPKLSINNRKITCTLFLISCIISLLNHSVNKHYQIQTICLETRPNSSSLNSMFEFLQTSTSYRFLSCPVVAWDLPRNSCLIARLTDDCSMDTLSDHKSCQGSTFFSFHFLISNR